MDQLDLRLQVRLAGELDVPALRLLVNAAYRQLADMGLNFTGTYQDEQVTRERMQGREVYLVFREQELVGSSFTHFFHPSSIIFFDSNDRLRSAAVRDFGLWRRGGRDSFEQGGWLV